jgi:hypothetical protein
VTTEERLAALEKKVVEFDSLLEYLMLLAAKHPVGRAILKQIAKKGS